MNGRSSRVRTPAARPSPRWRRARSARLVVTGARGSMTGAGGSRGGPPLGLGLLRGDLRGVGVPALLQVGEPPGVERADAESVRGAVFEDADLHRRRDVRSGEPPHIQLPPPPAHGVHVPRTVESSGPFGDAASRRARSEIYPLPRSPFVHACSG